MAEDKTSASDETAKVSKREAILARDKYERQSIAAGAGQPTDEEIRDQRLQALDSTRELPELQDPSTLISKLQETVREIVVSWYDSIQGRRSARARWDLVYNRFAWLKDDLLCFLRTRRPGIETRELAAELESFAALATWYPKVEPDEQLLQRTWKKIRILERHIRGLKEGPAKEKARQALLKRMDEIDNLSAKASSDITLQLKDHAPELDILSRQVMRRLVMLQHELCAPDVPAVSPASCEETPDERIAASTAEEADPQAAKPELWVDNTSLRAFWGREPLKINSHRHLEVLRYLIATQGRFVPYIELLREIIPGKIHEAVDNKPSAPPEVTDSLRCIRAALQKAGAPFKCTAIRGKGIKLEPL